MQEKEENQEVQNQNNEQNPTHDANIHVMGVDHAAGKDAAVLFVYDTKAGQRVMVEVVVDEVISKYAQVFKPFNNSIENYDLLREVNLSGEGNEQELETASEVADNFFFEENCIDVDGIEGEKPENWQDEIDLDERQAGIRRLLAVKVIKETDKPKVVKARKWGEKLPVSSNTIRLLSTFNTKEVETSITFAQKRPSDISKYNRLKAKIALKEGKGFEDSKIKIPAQMAAKSEIANDIGYTSTGYRDGIVPMHHLAIALTAYFDKSIKTNQKK